MIPDISFNAAFHASPIGQYLLAPTDKLEILAVNDAFLHAVSRRREEVLGTPLFEAFGSDPDDPDNTGVRDLDRSIRTAIATGQSQKMPVQRYPIKMHKDGQSWFEDMYWSATNTPVYDREGGLLCISHTTIDITAQVLAEKALRVSREEAVRHAHSAEAERAYLAGVLQAAPMGVIVVDKTMTVRHRNSAHMKLFGEAIPRSSGKIDFERWNGWFIDGDRAGCKLMAHEWPLHRACGGETVDRCMLEVEAFLPEAPRRMMMVSAAPIGDGTDVLGAVAVSVDIAQRVRAEQALKEADQRKDEFLAMLAHELRNPLAPIGSAAALLALDGTNIDHVKRSSSVIRRQVQHMTALIDELLDVARVTRGLIKLDKTVLDAKQVVAEALEQVRPIIESRNHTLQVSQPPLSAFVRGDQKRLVQVIANLLNNAAKFTPEGGIIRVELAIDRQHVRVTVQDNGVGMSRSLIDKAFELFTQAERTSDRSQGGLGIGLALVRSLVELHDGVVFAESDGADQGARFTVCLPRLEADHSPVREAKTIYRQPDAVGLRVLMVDDNIDALDVLEMLLTSMGHEVASTPHSTEAMEQAHAFEPQVCLLDIGLPHIDGLTLAGMLRKDPLTRDTTLIAMSGYGQDTDRAAARSAGFDYYFVKPVDAGELAALLRQIGQQHSAA
ncbi:ATP-binding protein [Massilia sp. METH4]|uniref:PAS domain-containing hybrid sensor histidine kinase/response regulator n=1 Tax=Massilia sp. METH4 TaxID=3123041 RepID=UPI0030D23365